MTGTKIFTPDEIKAENAMLIGKEIFDHTQVIYFINKKGKPEAVSSAIGLKCQDNYFIVTAAHTLRQFKNQILGIIPDSQWIELYGEHVYTNSGKIDEDKFDVGVHRLENNIIQKIGDKMKFFDLANFFPDHEDEVGQSYMVVGHPLSKVKLIHAEGRKHLAPFLFLSDLNQQDKMFFNQGFNKLTHQFFNYRQRRIYEYMTRKMVQGPEPKGLSGCAIWKVSDLIVNDFRSVQFYPTGIVIEYIKEYSVLVVTRINVISELIRQSFDVNIRKSKAIKIRGNMKINEE